jgi:hypothetical protein
MRYFNLSLALVLAIPAWCAAGQDKPVPFDPILFDGGGTKAGARTPWQGVTKKPVSTMHYFLPTGFTFPVRLQNAVYSYNVESPAIAVIERPVEYLQKVVLPAGTQVIGTVSIQQDHDRILVNFHTMVFPEGDEVKFTGMALSLDGSAGIKGKVETHKDSSVANTVLRSFVTGTSQALTMTGISPIASSAAQGLGGEATKELDTQKQQVTTSISVDAETGLRVYIPQRLEY